MSWDYQSAARPCGHEIVLERYVLDAFDFRTLHYAKDPSLNMRAPINGVSAVKVWIAGVRVPPSQYSIVLDPARIETNFTFMKIVFNDQVRLTRPLIEVSYITRKEFCLQCGGSGKVTDWAVSHSGSLIHTTGTKKLAQQCIKYMLTSKNPFSPNLVSQLKNYLGKKFNFSVSSQDIATELTRVLEAYQQIQASQKTVQTLDPTEVLREITNIAVNQDPTNPSLIYVSVVVSAYGSNQSIPLNIALQKAK